MNDILKFLINYCSDLYLTRSFKFIDSEVSQSFGNAILVLSNGVTSLKFTMDKGQMFLDFKSDFSKKKNDWYSFDLIRKLLREETGYYSILDDSNGKFISENLLEILSLFTVEMIDKTLMKLSKLEKKRAKFLFG